MLKIRGTVIRGSRLVAIKFYVLPVATNRLIAEIGGLSICSFDDYDNALVRLRVRTLVSLFRNFKTGWLLDSSTTRKLRTFGICR